jgi:hypothetical protein
MFLGALERLPSGLDRRSFVFYRDAGGGPPGERGIGKGYIVKPPDEEGRSIRGLYVFGIPAAISRAKGRRRGFARDAFASLAFIVRGGGGAS